MHVAGTLHGSIIQPVEPLVTRADKVVIRGSLSFAGASCTEVRASFSVAQLNQNVANTAIVPLSSVLVSISCSIAPGAAAVATTGVAASGPVRRGQTVDTAVLQVRVSRVVPVVDTPSVALLCSLAFKLHSPTWSRGC